MLTPLKGPEEGKKGKNKHKSLRASKWRKLSKDRRRNWLTSKKATERSEPFFHLQKVTSYQSQGCLGSTKEGRCQMEKSVEEAGSKQYVWNEQARKWRKLGNSEEELVKLKPEGKESLCKVKILSSSDSAKWTLLCSWLYIHLHSLCLT